ncbi:MAG: helix-turn-helix domain-containing protein [Treponema sp.]|jgi:AraC-like DNA-binding protein/ligand-binding sensor protein|nr:helix-turn-helix domain-containing protein [Treponema sp.]
MSPNNSSNIIIRREIEPLLLKAREVLHFYEKATDVTVSVLDQTGHSIPEFSGEAYCPSEFFCSLCRKYSKKFPAKLPTEIGRNWKEGEYPCTQIHIDSISRAQRSRGVYIYTCDLGFTYWVCPLSSSGRPAGALIAGLVLGVSVQESAEKIFRKSRGQISQESATLLLARIPEKTEEEIKAMARLLLICARQISRKIETHHETLKRRAEQQSKLSDQIEILKNQYNTGETDSGYSLEKERELLSALRRGDNEGARKVLDELLAFLFFSNPDNFKIMQYRAIELVVLISRAAVTSGNIGKALMEINNRYLMCIQDALTIEEIIDVLYQMVDSMGEQISPFKGVRHASSLRKAEQYIRENYTRKVSLREVADVSGLSAPYFSTVFKEEMGENFSSYLNRLRVDRAVSLLVETGLSLSEIVGSCGFEDQSWFSKIFKIYTGMSPGKYRDQNRRFGAVLSADNLSVDDRSTDE